MTTEFGMVRVVRPGTPPMRCWRPAQRDDGGRVVYSPDAESHWRTAPPDVAATWVFWYVDGHCWVSWETAAAAAGIPAAEANDEWSPVPAEQALRPCPGCDKPIGLVPFCARCRNRAPAYVSGWPTGWRTAISKATRERGGTTDPQSKAQATATINRINRLVCAWLVEHPAKPRV